MNNMVKVSIVVPVYNVEKYVGQCVESLINQTLNEIEIICVNDGSTDGSLAILEEYAARDNRIRIITKENSGYGHTMNVGFDAATGEYIGIVESDDYALPDMFEKLYTLAKQYDVDIVKSNYYEHADGFDRIYTEMLKGVPYDKVITAAESPQLLMTSSIAIWSAIYRNAFIKEKKVTFHETPGASYQDVSFAYISLASAEKVLCTKDAYLCYRIDNVGSSVKSREKVFCIMEEFKRWEEFARKNGLEDLVRKICACKFRHFMGHYDRVDDLFKYAFIIKVAEIFNEDNQKGLLDQSYWDETNWEQVQKIMTNPTVFFKDTCEEYRNRYVLGKYIINESIKNNSVRKELQEAENVVIYGAGKYGLALYEKIKDYAHVKCFAVTTMERNQAEIDGVPVYKIADLCEQKEECLVVVGVTRKYQLQVLSELSKLGFLNVVIVEENTQI